MKRLHLYCEEDFSDVEEGMLGFVETDTDLAAELLFVDEAEIRSLNKETRGIDSVTDVLSFPTLNEIRGKTLRKREYPYDVDDEGNLFLGSIVICKKRAEEQAAEYGHSYHRELYYLIVHGLMHLLGYDHMTEEERGEMRQKEEWVLGNLGITRDE